MQHQLYPAAERGVKDIGWLQSNFTFSFSSFAHPVKNGFGLLRVFNDDFVEPGKGFGLHAHQNMEIISIMLEGSMNHKDNMGYSEVVHKDWVQIMSAGSGLRHEEYNVGEEQVNFLQIWIEPKLQNINPRYQRRFFPEKNRANQLVTVVSNEEGQQHCWINQNARLSLGYYPDPAMLDLRVNPLNKAFFLFVMEGAVTLNNIPVTKRNAIGCWDTDFLLLDIAKDSRFLLIETPVNH